MKVRLWLGVAGATLVAALLSPAVAWFMAVSRFEAGLDKLTLLAAGYGMKVTYDRPRIGGFPSHITFALENLKIALPAAGLVYEMPPLPIAASAFGDGPIVIDLSGHHTYRASIGGRPIETTVDAKDSHMELVIAPDKWTLTSTSGASSATSSMGITSRITGGSSTVTFSWPSSGHASVVLICDVNGIDWFGPDGTPIVTPAIDRIHLDFIMGLPPRFARPGLVAWLGEGDELVLRDLTAEWNGLSLKAKGMLGSDPRLASSGTLNVTVDGFEEALQRLEATGTIAADGAAELREKAAAHLVAAGDGKRSRLTLSFAARDGVLFLNGEPLTSPNSDD